MSSIKRHGPRMAVVLVAVALVAVGVVVVRALTTDDAPAEGLDAYVVQPGDSWYEVSRSLGSGDVSADASYLAEINDEQLDSQLSPGQVIEYDPDQIDPTSTTVTPPPKPTFVAGAAVQPVMVGGTMQTWSQATSAFESLVQHPLAIARRFSPEFPTTFADLPEFAVDTGVRHRFISVKGDPSPADWARFLESVPQDGFHTWVTINHEPENDGDHMTPEVFKEKSAVMLDAIRATERTDLHPAVVLTTWLERDDDATSTSAAWFPNEPAAFTLGLDPYDICGCTAFADLVNPTLALWREAGGVDWAISETGTKQTGDDGAVWIEGMFDFCRADRACLGPMWFHAAVGANGPWWLEDPVMLEAYGAQMAAG
jgi:hypothetical protein